MRRAIIFLILLAIMCAVAFTVYIAYSNHGQAAELVDLSSDSRVLDSNGNFSGRFKSNEKIMSIKDFTYEVVEDDLHLTVYVGTGGNALETDDEGYVLIEISGLPEIDKVYYVYDDSKTVLPTERE